MESEAEIVRHEKKPVLLLFPAPFQGHMNPMLQLAHLLHSKGFSITIFHTHFNSPNPSNHPKFNFIPIADGLSDAQTSTIDNMVEFISIMNTNCKATFHDRLAQTLSEKNKREEIKCIISDVLMQFTEDAATHFNIPRVVLRTNGATSTVSIYSFMHLMKEGCLDLKDPKSEAPIPELPPLRVKDLPEFCFVEPDAADQVRASMIKTTASSSGMILNSFDELEQSALVKLREDLPIPVFPIGPLYKYWMGSSRSSEEEDLTCMVWLDKQKPMSVLYISFGTSTVLEKTELEEIAWGLANSEQPFLWVIRHDSIRGHERIELPQEFKDKTANKGLIVKWVPQSQVLAHPAVGGFWTHSGWNSTLESMGEGIPMICWPYFWDQKVNARYVSQVWKVGIQLESRLERNEIERAIRSLMVKEGNDVRERVKDLKKTIERSLSVGGSSYVALENLIKQIESL